MANNNSAKKRIRQNEARRVRNRYYKTTTRNAIKRLRNTSNAGDAQKMLPEVTSMIDKLTKRNIFHKNKAANLKSKLAKHVNSL